MKYKLFFLTPLFLFLIFHSALAETGLSNTNIVLRFKPSEKNMSFLATYHKQITNIINESDDTGKSRTLRNESYEYAEMLKDKKQYSTGNLIDIVEKISFLKKETNGIASSSAKPINISTQVESLGRLNIPFSMLQLPFSGIPVTFPQEPVNENQEWSGSFDFKDGDLPPLNLKQNFTLKKILTIGDHTVAEIDYTVQTQLRSTDLGNDSIVQQKIQQLQNNNIESLSYDGKGSLTFDFTSGHIHTHTLTLTQRLSQVVILNNSRTLKETVTTHEFAEALLP